MTIFQIKAHVSSTENIVSQAAPTQYLDYSSTQ
jgi:hypothetical protein